MFVSDQNKSNINQQHFSEYNFFKGTHIFSSLQVSAFSFCISQLKDHKGKDESDKPDLSQKSLKAQKKMKPPDAAGIEIS